MKCLFGIYHMDEGEVFVDGEKVNINNPDEALHKGLAMVHQELQPVPERTIAENMYLGRYPTKSVGPLKVIDLFSIYEDFTFIHMINTEQALHEGGFTSSDVYKRQIMIFVFFVLTPDTSAATSFPPIAYIYLP